MAVNDWCRKWEGDSNLASAMRDLQIVTSDDYIAKHGVAHSQNNVNSILATIEARKAR